MTGDARARVETALLVLAVLATVAAATVVLSGGVASQSATRIDLEDPIAVNQDSFTVTVTDLGAVDGSNCMRVSKTTGSNPAVITLEDFSEGETRTVDRSSVGGYQIGDVIDAEFGENCTNMTSASDSTRVSGYGTVSILGPVIADETSFEVEVTELVSESGEGCVRVENTARDDRPTNFGNLREGDTITVVEDDVGGWSGGDELVVRLYDETCEEFEFDVDTTVVEARGDVELEDRIFENQSSFQVSVERLRIDGLHGCVRVDNRAAGSTELIRVGAGETRTVAREDVGGYEQNDEIVATLFSENDCTGSELDTDSEIVFGVPTPTATAAPTATATASPTATATETSTPSGTPRGGSGGGSTPQFDVTIDEARLPADEGDPLEVYATIENTGDARDTQTVRLWIDGEERDVSQLSLDSGESRSVRFSWDEPDDARQHDIEVASHDDTDDTLAQLGEPGEGESPGGSGGLLLLLLLILALLAYYYVRRRQSQRGPDYAERDEE